MFLGSGQPRFSNTPARATTRTAINWSLVDTNSPYKFDRNPNCQEGLLEETSFRAWGATLQTFEWSQPDKYGLNAAIVPPRKPGFPEVPPRALQGPTWVDDPIES